MYKIYFFKKNLKNLYSNYTELQKDSNKLKQRKYKTCTSIIKFFWFFKWEYSLYFILHDTITIFDSNIFFF